MALGSLLSIALAGCAHRPAEPLPPPPIAIAVKDVPPAELLACPVPPAGFSEDAAATIPPVDRSAAMALALAYAGVSLQLVRLINWNSPGSCR